MEMGKTKYPENLTFDPEAPFDEGKLPGFVTIIPDCEFFRLQRVGFGMTQEEVAKRAGISMWQYKRIESGKTSIASESLTVGLAICDVLQLDPHRFVPKTK